MRAATSQGTKQKKKKWREKKEKNEGKKKTWEVAASAILCLYLSDSTTDHHLFLKILAAPEFVKLLALCFDFGSRTPLRV
jgi:hypothetical protein